MRSSQVADEIYPSMRMRSSQVVRASDCQCTSCNSPGFDPSIRRHSGIWGAADETVLNTYSTLENLPWLAKRYPSGYGKLNKLLYSSSSSQVSSPFQSSRYCMLFSTCIKVNIMPPPPSPPHQWVQSDLSARFCPLWPTLSKHALTYMYSIGRRRPAFKIPAGTSLYPSHISLNAIPFLIQMWVIPPHATS
jgi:hypothetical protein